MNIIISSLIITGFYLFYYSVLRISKIESESNEENY